MNEEEKAKLILEFTYFINTHYDLVKLYYNLFKNGESKINFNDYEIELNSTNFDKIKKPKDTLITTMLLMYISMKQLDNLDEKYIELTDNEMIEIINFCDYLKENRKDFINELENN